jgi:hypothetical protein
MTSEYALFTVDSGSCNKVLLRTPTYESLRPMRNFMVCYVSIYAATSLIAPQVHVGKVHHVHPIGPLAL